MKEKLIMKMAEMEILLELEERLTRSEENWKSELATYQEKDEGNPETEWARKAVTEAKCHLAAIEKIREYIEGKIK